MIKKALDKYPNIEKEDSILIGNSKSDYKLAKKINISFYGIKLDCKNRLDNLKIVPINLQTFRLVRFLGAKVVLWYNHLGFGGIL